MANYTVAYDTDTEILRRLSKIHILVCNNSEQVTKLVNDLLGEVGFTSIYICHNVFEAVKIMKRREIHLLIIDSELRMPKKENILDGDLISEDAMQSLSGYSFVLRLRHARRSPNRFIPILMMLDEKDPDQITKARDCGVTEVLPHPLDAKNLFKQLIEIIDKPRVFVTSERYKGPCRRREVNGKPPEGMEERRKSTVTVIQYRREPAYE